MSRSLVLMLAGFHSDSDWGRKQLGIYNGPKELPNENLCLGPRPVFMMHPFMAHHVLVLKNYCLSLAEKRKTYAQNLVKSNNNQT